MQWKLFSRSPKPYKGQDYVEIKKNLGDGELFRDTEFPPEASSLYYQSFESYESIEWKRPKELCSDPKFVVEGLSSMDVNQGKLGNCWFVAACSALTHNRKLLSNVIPDKSDQEWDPDHPERYKGMFHFRFWRFGEWTDVVVDDFLPTIQGQLIYASSKTPNEFWSALLEKAFAKLVGSYEALAAGALSEALVDLSGGVPETMELDAYKAGGDGDPDALFRDLKIALKAEALLAASIKAESRYDMEQQLSCGLVKGHAYAITALKSIKYEDLEDSSFWNGLWGLNRKKQYMVRMQNPWGAKEWNGAWSDNSSEWDLVTERQKEAIGLTKEDDGEFWMPWSDFCRYMTSVCVCYQINTSWISLDPRYDEYVFVSGWKCANPPANHLNDRAGGCPNNRLTFFWNPQFYIHMEDSLNAEEDGSSQPILIHLLQKDVRHLKRAGRELKTIGIQLMQVEDNRTHRAHIFGKRGPASTYINSRSVFLRLNELAAGRHFLLPSTFDAGQETEFLLRMYVPKAFGHEVKEVSKDLCQEQMPPQDFGSKCLRVCCPCTQPNSYPPPRICKLTIMDAHNVPREYQTYVHVECDDQDYYSFPQPISDSPNYNYSILLLREASLPKYDLLIRLMEKHTLKDQEIGHVRIDLSDVRDAKKAYRLPLLGSEPPKDGEKPLPTVEVEVIAECWSDTEKF